MREVPRIESADIDVLPTHVEFRRRKVGGVDQGDWYVTWTTRNRPWEITVMRLPCSEHSGQAWHHGRTVDYRVNWHWEDVYAEQRLRSGGGAGRALVA